MITPASSRNSTIWVRSRCAAGYLASQRGLQPPHLGFAAFHHLSPRIRCERIKLREKKQLANLFQRLPSEKPKNRDSSRHGGAMRVVAFRANRAARRA